MRNVLIACVVVVIVLAVLLIPMVPVQETYTETEPYERRAQYEVVSTTLKEETELLGRGVYHVSEVVVKNIDSKGGTFTVTLSLYDIDGLYGKKSPSDYIAPGTTKAFRAEFDTRLGQDVRGEYSVSAPKVTDERLVTKERTVYKSIFGLLLQ